MPLLHEPTVRTSIRQRVESLRPDSTRQWGKMSVGQMLWHCNTALEQAVGRFKPRPGKLPLPKPLLKFVVLNFPWGKGAPTNADFVATAQHDFETERDRSLKLIDEITSKDIGSSWPVNEDFGRMSGKDWSRLMAKHLDHHLKQFGA